jgi:hypothetical protein
MNPIDNAENLPATYLAELQALPARERMRALYEQGKVHHVGAFPALESPTEVE